MPGISNVRLRSHAVSLSPCPHSEKKPKKDDEIKEKENNFSMQVVGSTKPSVARIAQEKFDRPDDEGNPAKGRGVLSNAYASGNSQNTGNVITDRPSSRVTQPPGGKSSISFY